ncbi:MAG: DUF1801 domain-containing protein [Pirellulales bacterium]|nr:DUF1801 domain-containing protein [Pirellulales bacterium]
MKRKKGSSKGKALKPLSSKKPPEPTNSHAAVDDWMRRVKPDLQPIVAHLDALIRATIPNLQYAVKWKRPYYGLPQRGWLIELAVYDVSVNLVFFGGAEFDPPPPLGSVGRSRYVKLCTLEEAQQASVRNWIAQAAHVDGWK